MNVSNVADSIQNGLDSLAGAINELRLRGNENNDNNNNRNNRVRSKGGSKSTNGISPSVRYQNYAIVSPFEARIDYCTGVSLNDLTIEQLTNFKLDVNAQIICAEKLKLNLTCDDLQLQFSNADIYKLFPREVGFLLSSCCDFFVTIINPSVVPRFSNVDDLLTTDTLELDARLILSNFSGNFSNGMVISELLSYDPLLHLVERLRVMLDKLSTLRCDEHGLEVSSTRVITIKGNISKSCKKCVSLLLCSLIFSITRDSHDGKYNDVRIDANNLLINIAHAYLIQYNIIHCHKNRFQVIDKSANVMIFDYAYSVKMISSLLCVDNGFELSYVYNEINKKRYLLITVPNRVNLTDVLMRFTIKYLATLHKLGIANFTLSVTRDVRTNIAKGNDVFEYKPFTFKSRSMGCYFSPTSFYRTATIAMSAQHSTFEILITPHTASISDACCLKARLAIADLILTMIRSDVGYYFMPTTLDYRFRFVWKSDLSPSRIQHNIDRVFKVLVGPARKEFFSKAVIVIGDRELSQRSDIVKEIYVHGILSFHIRNHIFKNLVFVATSVPLRYSNTSDVVLNDSADT